MEADFTTKTDAYAYGMCMLELLSGNVVRKDNTSEIDRLDAEGKHAEANAIPVRGEIEFIARNPYMSDAQWQRVLDILLPLVDMDPDNRPDDLEAVASRLESIIPGMVIEQKETLLHKAVVADDVVKIKDLVSKGVSLLQENKSGKSPEDLLLETGSQELLFELFESSNNNGKNIFHTLCEKSPDKLMQTLEDYDISGIIEKKDRNGFTPLLKAVAAGNRDLVEFFIDNGADIDAKKDDGFNPLLEAVYNNDIKMVELLAAYGANLAYLDPNWNAIMHAVSQNSAEMVGVLTSLGADINQADGNYWTALHLAACNGNEEMVIALLNCESHDLA